MNAEQLRGLLEQVRVGERTVDAAYAALKDLPYQDLGFARLDHHRALRQGFPEVVFCEGKRVEHIVEIMQHLTRERGNIPCDSSRAARREIFRPRAHRRRR